MLLSPGPLLALLLMAPPSYTSLRGSADPVQNLGRFLERVLGDCEGDDPQFDKKACEARASAEQARLADKTLLIEVESPDEQLHFAEWDGPRRAFRLHLTPFFGDRALALTIGRPERLNKDGLPVLKNIPIWVRADDEKARDVGFRRQLERGMVRLELLVKPRKAWRMKKKDGDGDYRGLDVALVGLRVYSLQGQMLAEQTY